LRYLPPKAVSSLHILEQALLMNWDLSSYFPSPDHADTIAFKQQLTDDLTALLQKTSSLAPLAAANLDDWESALLSSEDILCRVSHLGSYLGCLTAADAANESYRKQEAAFAVLDAEVEKLDVEFQRGLKGVSDADVDELLRRETLAGCSHYVGRLREAAEKTMSLPEEHLAADLNVNGLHAWGRLYDNVSGKLEFEMKWPDGRSERLPMSQRRSLLSNPDRAIRRAAFDGGNAAWEDVIDVNAAAINAIAGTRLSLNQHRRIDHFLDVALSQAKISRASLDAMFAAIHERRHVAQKILQIKAQAQGTTGVAWYDLEAPLPTAHQKSASLSWEAGKAQVYDAFAKSYPDLASFTDVAYDKNWIEWEPRAGKRPGAFCTGSLLTMEPRVYMTFNGSSGDVRTLAHELGHAFHHHILQQTRPFGHLYPMTLAESASTFAEMILTDGQLNDPNLSDAQRLAILDTETGNGAVFLTDLPVRFEFEKAFHEERAHGEVEVSRLKELMVETQQRLFGDALEEGGEDPFFWASKLHFYITGVTFYNFPYTYGFLLSRGLFAQFKQEGPDFLPRYEDFLRRTGQDMAEGVARDSMGLDLTSPEFWMGAIDTLQEPVKQLESLLASQNRDQ
jgi:oligoendopeptidase F